jgi:purine-binding chemotaxis protein CheW
VGLRWRREFVREFVRHGDGVIVLPSLTAIFQANPRHSGRGAAHDRAFAHQTK